MRPIGTCYRTRLIARYPETYLSVPVVGEEGFEGDLEAELKKAGFQEERGHFVRGEVDIEFRRPEMLFEVAYPYAASEHVADFLEAIEKDMSTGP